MEELFQLPPFKRHVSTKPAVVSRQADSEC
eukprot:COSAG06_NODE_56570_length_284_cov_0.783784_1_plen_29_part_10